MDRVEIKKRAKEFAFQNKWNIWKPLLIMMCICGAASYVLGFICGILKLPAFISGLLEIALSLAAMPLTVGLASYLIKFINGKKADIMEELLSRYKDGSYMNIILVMFLAGLFIALWSLLFVIPGIICAIAYAMTAFIMAEQSSDEIKDKKAYEISKKMMDGHKMDYFVFQLSFILWIIGTSFTLGILAIWTVPYMTTANVMWYEELKKISK